MLAPLRCHTCGAVIRRKPKAKVPKYCVPCREAQQEEYRNTPSPRPGR